MPERPFDEEIGAGAPRVAFADESRYGYAIAPDIATNVRDIAVLLGKRDEERALVLPADPAEVLGSVPETRRQSRSSFWRRE